MPESRVFGADEVARKDFATSFRGFDQHEVRSFLGRLAAELAALQTRERSLEERLVAADARAVPTEIGETELENALGHETAKVLHAAREAASEIRGRAEEQVARLLREAGDDATRLREEASTVLADRTAEAERAAAAIVDEAVRDVAARRTEAEAAATATIDAAKEHGRQMVGEAQVVRERILKDLARRRRAGQQQLEQLRAGRDRLLEACRAVQAALDEAVAELVVSEPEARAAAETAGLRVAAEPELTVEALEVEVRAAVDAGLVVPPHLGSAEAGTDPDDEATAGASADVEATPSPDRPDQTFAEVVEALASAPAPPAESSAPQGPSSQEQRPSLRRRKKRGAPATVGVVDVGSEGEGVRLIPNDPPASPVVEPAVEPLAPESPAPDHDAAGPDTSGEEPVVEPPAGAGGAADELAPSEPDGEVPPSLTLVTGSGGEDEVGEAKGAVDDVFARIRATRAASVAHATDVLATSATDPDGADGEGTVGGDVDVAGSPPAEASDEAPEDGAELGDAGALATVFEQRDAALEAHERSLTKALKRALADEQNELLDALRRARGVPDLDVLLPAAADHEARYRAVGVEPLAAAGAAGAGVEDAVDLGEVLASLGREVVAGLRPRLEHALEEAGGDEAVANESLSGAYREWKTSRAEPLARHHVLAAHAEGAFQAAGSGPLRWVVDPEAGCSPDCADNALAGPTPKGEPFPTGPIHPPAHAGCRCLVLPAAN